MAKLNWYGQTLMDYQKANCVLCLADLPHRAHLTELEAMQSDIVIPRPTSLYLREVIDQGGFDAIAAHQEVTEPAA